MSATRLARALLAAALATAGTAARAQDVPHVISPLRVETDHNDVNMATGKTAPAGPVLSVPAAPNLVFDRVQNAAPYVTGRVSGGPGDIPVGNYSVHGGSAASDSFLCGDTVDCESVTGTGATFRPVGPNSYRYRQAGSGAVYTFNLMHVNAGGSPRTVQYYASRIAWPNGEAIDYAYDTILYNGLTYYRPATLTSNLGYAIALTYQGSDFAADPTSWASVASATLSTTGPSPTTLRRLTYGGGTVTDSGDTIADTSDDRTYGCAGCGGTLGVEVEGPSATLQLPGEAALAVQAVAHPNAQVVASVTRDGVPWTYAYQNLRQETGNLTWLFDGITVTGPNGFSQTYHTIQGGPAKSRFNAVTGITDSLGRTTGAVIDMTTMRVTAMAFPEGNAVSVQYDDAGNIVARVQHARPGTGLADITQTAGFTLPSLANTCNVSCWRPDWTRDAMGRQTDYLYNGNGQLIEQDDPADADGVRRRMIVDYAPSPAGISRRSVVRVCGVGTTCGTSAELRTEYQYWNDTPLVTRERRIDGATGQALDTANSYDAAGRLLVTDGPLPGTDDATYNRYDAFGRRTWEIGALAPNGLRIATRTVYRDSDDKPVSSETGTIPDANGTSLTVFRRTDFAYDARRNPVREALSSAGTTYTVTQRTFEESGRLQCQAVRMNPAVFASLPADACAHGTAGGHGPDRIARTVYDAAGQRLQLRAGVGTAIEAAEATWAYNDNGQVVTVIDGNGNRAALVYDGHGRQSCWMFPATTRAAAYDDVTQASALASAGALGGTIAGGVCASGDYEAYEYDANGNRVTLRKRDGRRIAFAYDALNRVTAKTYPDGGATAVHYAYDLRNLQLSARFGSQSGEGITSAYDGFGRLASSSTNMGDTTRTLAYQYDPEGNRTRITHPDGAVFDTVYDGLGRPVSVADQVTARYLVGYAPHGAPLGVIRNNATMVIYGYDAVQRLGYLAMGHDFPGYVEDVMIMLDRNPAGQISTISRSNDAYAWTGAYSVSRAYATNGLNQYTATGTAAFTYDANGNLISDGSTSFTYDIENRLIGRSGGVSLSYDPLGRLYEVTGASGTTRFLYDGDALVAEYDGTGAMTRRYVHNEGVDVPLLSYAGTGLTQLSYLHADHQGSIVAVSDAAGVSAINAYDEYGIPGAGNSGRFQYTGQIWLPELGMYHYKARVYSPTLGRFLQTDPVGYEDQFNLYAYVGNDPVNGTDPTGEKGTVPCTGSRIGCGDVNGGNCATCAGFGGLGYPRTDLSIDRSKLTGGETQRGDRIQTACFGFLSFLRGACVEALRRIFGRGRGQSARDTLSREELMRQAGFRSNSDFGEAVGWGNGRTPAETAAAARSRIGEITRPEVARMARQRGVTKELVTAWRNDFRAAIAQGRGGVVTPARADLMDAILRNWPW